MGSARVAVIMGSDSDWPIMESAALTLAEFKIAFRGSAKAHSIHHRVCALIETYHLCRSVH